MKLSICMMVKNEEKHLEECLKSLQPLRKAVSSELIIVDTGSADSTIEIAKKYTESVYFHEWNNNFSEMRNITINYAKGEWILIIDGDEVLEESEEIIKYFHSTVGDKFGAVALTVKNLLDEDKDYHYALLQSPRIFKNDGFFHYKGSVHNDPIFKGECLALNSVLIHYGYISTDEELMEKKYQRTKKMLEEELKKEPENIYYQYQLSVTYMMHKDYSKALNESLKAYKMFEKIKSNERKMYFYIIPNHIKTLLINGLYFEVEKISKEALKIEPDHIDIYFYLAQAQIKVEKYEDAIKTFKKYMDLCSNYEKLSIRFNPTMNIYTLASQNEGKYGIAYSLYKKKEFKEAIKYLKNIDIKSEPFYAGYKLFVEISFITKDLETLFQFYKNNIAQSSLEIQQNFFNEIEKNKNNLLTEEKIQLTSYFSGSDNSYFDLNRIRCAMYEKNEDIDTMIKEFIKKVKFDLLEEYYADIIYYFILYKKSVSHIVYDLSTKSIQLFMRYLFKNYSNFKELLQDYIIKNTSYNFVDLKSHIILQRCYLIMGNDVKEKNLYSSIFKAYIDNGKKYVTTVYTPFVIENELIREVQNEEDEFFIYMYLAENIKEQNQSEYIHYLRRAVAAYPYMKDGIELMLEEFNEEENSTLSEFEQYKIQIKDTIREFILKEDLDNANVLIDEYEKIVKDDVEILLLKSEIALAKLKEKNNSVNNYKM
ncbi:Glycosyl transferase family 2 [Hathewaya proteolytica DSM 3090]|uniref:Glycosyl transferase family 2 n=1 Tax=Hathewaya proteolytica DSM 3090 TaxID=1121331 RepID=A0A1M6JS90_9CLOT|nr:glycosyltransferase [Hathewaya proteolytica]SHJ49551.1 Glycosyl transferase family 2 [Hathewaya proteolytica DSM 3090]